jgi:hypothetical protein
VADRAGDMFFVEIQDPPSEQKHVITSIKKIIVSVDASKRCLADYRRN